MLIFLKEASLLLPVEVVVDVVAKSNFESVHLSCHNVVLFSKSQKSKIIEKDFNLLNSPDKGVAHQSICLFDLISYSFFVSQEHLLMVLNPLLLHFQFTQILILKFLFLFIDQHHDFLLVSLLLQHSFLIGNFSFKASCLFSALAFSKLCSFQWLPFSFICFAVEPPVVSLLLILIFDLLNPLNNHFLKLFSSLSYLLVIVSFIVCTFCSPSRS